MKILLILTLLISGVTVGFSQEKVKVKFKKKNILVDKVIWGSYEYSGGKHFVKTVAGEEFASINRVKYGTGRYNKSTGEEITKSYSEVHFYNSEIPLFEVDFGALKSIIQLFVEHKILVDDKFNEENALEFKNKYAEEISKRIFRTK